MGVFWAFPKLLVPFLLAEYPNKIRHRTYPEREERKLPHGWKTLKPYDQIEQPLDHRSWDLGSSPGFVMDKLQILLPTYQCPNCLICFTCEWDRGLPLQLYTTKNWL